MILLTLTIMIVIVLDKTCTPEDWSGHPAAHMHLSPVMRKRVFGSFRAGQIQSSLHSHRS